MSSNESKMDFFEVGDKTSLICAESTVADVIRTTLKELNFKCHTVDSSETAVERLRYTQYDIIVVQENFAGSSLKTNAALNYLGPLPMAQRRYSMVVLVGSSFKTLDAMQAFGQSVHLVINTSDLANLTAILKKSWAEFDNLYRVYKGVLAAMAEGA